MLLKKVKLSDVALIENSRANEEDCSELMESIKESGLIQPVVVTKAFNGRGKKPYVLVAGNRRFRAVKNLGEASVDAVINDNIKDMADLLVFNMSENLQRKDVSAFEQGRLLKLLITKHFLTKKECSVRLGITEARVESLLNAFGAFPQKYTEKITTDTNAVRKKGLVGLSTATTVANLQKSNLISRSEGQEILDGVLNGKYNSTTVRAMAGTIRKGASFRQFKNGSKSIGYTTVRVPLYVSEKEDIEGGITEYLMQLIYGESKDHFTRPRF